MKEHNFIEIIKNITNSSYLGDDCAYLPELDIVITQDNFIEDIHFKTDWATPFQIGYKAAAVNISDILASGAKPEYITVGLSIPDVDEIFINELYKGIVAGSYGAKVIGGDITGANKIFISITAIGKTKGRNISSRKNAKPDYVIVTNSTFGESAIGLQELQQGKKKSRAIKAHLEPKLDIDFSKNISTTVKESYAMMDTSDGLADALFQIAKASNVKIITPNIAGIFGAEDYKLIAAIPKTYISQLPNYNIIGKVEPFDGTYLQIDKKIYSRYNELGLYDHFGS